MLDVIGVGGTGTQYLESIVPMMNTGSQVCLFDHDEVAIENLEIQSPYQYYDVGRPKAKVIAEKLRSLYNTKALLLPFVKTYQEKPKGKFFSNLGIRTARIVCGDNLKIRHYANELCIQDNTPLLEVGSSPLVGQQRTYYPGKTACLAHRIPNLKKMADKEEKPTSCFKSDNPTLPGTNMVIGGIMAAETLKVLMPDYYGRINIPDYLYSS